MNTKIRNIFQVLKNNLEALYGERLVSVILFGSQARGDAEDGSDIDVLVILKGDVNSGKEIERTSDIVARLSLKHDAVIGRVFMDEHRFIHRNGPLLRNIRREGAVI